MDETEMNEAEALEFLQALATRAEDVIDTHIRGITFGHEDLRKLVAAVRSIAPKA